MTGVTRRGFMAAAAVAALPAVAQEAPGGAGQGPAGGTAPGGAGLVARGRVQDEAGQGIGDVLVSNGREVVASGADGAWSLPYREDDSLFVIKPSGWMVPVEAGTNLPRFAWAHAGARPGPAPRYAGVAPSGDAPDPLVFTLRRQAEPPDYTALVMTDPQPESEAELDYVRDDVIGRAAGFPAAFGITTGDVMFDDLSLYDRHNRIVGALGVPWWNVPGNHDMNLDAADDRLSRETFRRVYGARHYAFQWGGVTFLALDNVEYLGRGKYRGRFGEAQLGFVRAVLAHVPEQAPVVALMHIPLRTLVGEAENTACTDTAAFLDAIGTHRNILSLAGHTHTNERFVLGPAGHRHHVLSAASGSWWSGPADARGVPLALASEGSPNGFHVLRVAAGRVETRLVAAHEPAGAAMRLGIERGRHQAAAEMAAREESAFSVSRASLRREAVGSARLLANVFDAPPDTAVTLRIGEGEPRAMVREEREDPFVQLAYARDARWMKAWVTPTRCPHLWVAELGDLPAGVHRVEVRAGAAQGAMVLEVG